MTDPQHDADRDVEAQLAKIGTEFQSGSALPPDIPDKETLKAVESEESHVEKMRRLAAKDYEDRIESRRTYGQRAFILMVVWLTLVLLTVWASAAAITLPSWYPSWLPLLTEFKLSDTALISLLASSTANIFALVAAKPRVGPPIL